MGSPEACTRKKATSETPNRVGMEMSNREII
jgi:hypothetical protein